MVSAHEVATPTDLGSPAGRAGAGATPINWAANPPASRGIGAAPVGPQAEAAADRCTRASPPASPNLFICSVVG
ncbi:hypothetical protein [Brachybacterium sp. Z12]|uniref:hypothetical protein n=1 Tax=Brachybacterium sp. Z12 TaxID=2759167 RepID=UPI00223B17E6|nr:hypothetical protein [Brachybacterium sp. Z12]